MELDLILQPVGIMGIVVFYIVLAKLSARMGEGLMLPRYYLWDYVASVIIFMTIPAHAYLHLRYGIPHPPPIEFQVFYVATLLIGTIIVILVSLKYWWWLKDEIFRRAL